MPNAAALFGIAGNSSPQIEQEHSAAHLLRDMAALGRTVCLA